jgi:hypothetical protein
MSAIPSVKRPSWRWYVAYARLRAARVIELPLPQLLMRLTTLTIAGAVLVFAARHEFLSVPHVPNTPETQKAWVQFIWMIVAMIVSALIQYALRPKVKKPDPAKFNAPIAEDGKSVVRIYGPNWFDDSMVLAVKQFTPIPIKASGGKK